MRDDNCLTTHRSPIPPTLNKAAERSRPVSPHKKLRPNTPQVLFPPRTVKMHFEDLHATGSPIPPLRPPARKDTRADPHAAGQTVPPSSAASLTVVVPLQPGESPTAMAASGTRTLSGTYYYVIAGSDSVEISVVAGPEPDAGGAAGQMQDENKQNV